MSVKSNWVETPLRGVTALTSRTVITWSGALTRGARLEKRMSLSKPSTGPTGLVNFSAVAVSSPPLNGDLPGPQPNQPLKLAAPSASLAKAASGEEFGGLQGLGCEHQPAGVDVGLDPLPRPGHGEDG